MKKIKVLVIDDSVLFRSQIQAALQSCSGLELLGAASNGKLGLEKMISLDPDLCILDIEMPVMDGIETLKAMRDQRLRTKAIMFSSQSRAGADKTMEAMRLGALDFVPKPLADGSPVSPAEKIRDALLPKILSLFQPQLKQPDSIRPRSFFTWAGFSPSVLVIASSTGGPNALVEFFSAITEPLPFPVLVAQHMPPVFTASLAARIEASCGKRCKEGEHQERLMNDSIYIAPGNFHMSVALHEDVPRILLDQGPLRNYVRPCADFLLESAASVFGARTLGIVLTGMGRDGADGADKIKKLGGAVMIQNEASCIVFGMPGAVASAGLQDFSGTPVELAERLNQLVRSWRAHVA